MRLHTDVRYNRWWCEDHVVLGEANMRQFDVVVIGAGIAGSSVAFELATDHSVAVVDMESVAGYHSTGRSAALFSANFASLSTHALALDSLNFLRAPPPGFTDTALVTPRAVLWVSTERQMAAFDAMVREVKERGYQVRLLDGKETVAACPALRPESIAGGLLELDGFDMDVNALHQGYLRAAKALGASIFLNSALTRAEWSTGRWALHVGDELLVAPVVINAAGAWGDVVANRCGVQPLGLKSMRRTVATFDAPTQFHGSHWPFVYDIEEQFYFKLEHSTILASPSDETLQEPTDAIVDDLEIAVGVDRIQKVANLPVSRIRGSWAGLRVFSPDRDLVIGSDTRVQSFFWLVGQGGVGIMTAAGAARAAAGLLRGEKLSANLVQAGLTEKKLGPARFEKPAAGKRAALTSVLAEV